MQKKYTTDNRMGRPRSDAVTATLVAAGLDIIGESGIDAMTVRSLATRTHYSASTVGYHTSPMRTFVSRLWQQICSDLLTASVPLPGPAHWSARTAEQMLAWAHSRPNHTHFFVNFSPDRLTPHPLLLVEQCSAGAANHVDRLDEVLRFLVRRLQSAIELALATPARDEAVALLAGVVRADWQFWTEGQHSLPAPS